MALGTQCLKPTAEEILQLATREASVEHEREFRPICRGPWGNLFLLMAVGVLAIPGMVLRLIKGCVKE